MSLNFWHGTKFGIFPRYGGTVNDEGGGPVKHTVYAIAPLFQNGAKIRL